MKYVEIYKLKDDGFQEVICRAELVNDKVILKGDQNFIKNLEKEGVLDYSKKTSRLFPKGGLHFLEQLKYNFRSGYLLASDVIDFVSENEAEQGEAEV